MSFSAYVSFFFIRLAPDTLVDFSFYLFLSSLAHFIGHFIYLVLDSLVGFNFFISFSSLAHCIFNFVFKFGFNFCLAPDLFVGFKSRLALSILAWLAYSFISIWQYLLVCCSSVYSLVTYVFLWRLFGHLHGIRFGGFQWSMRVGVCILSMPRLWRTLLHPCRW